MMRLVTVLLLLLLVGFAIATNPSVRVGKLKDCDRLVITAKGKREPTTVYEKTKVEEFARLFVVSSNASKSFTAGEPEYRIEFWRGKDKKPTDVLWVDNRGQWGFANVRGIYGEERKLVTWLQKVLKQ